MKASSTSRVLAVNCPRPVAIPVAVPVMVLVAGKGICAGSNSGGAPRSASMLRICSSQPASLAW